ncbi:hypothetical protein HOY36_02865 [Enterococcus sp. MMGLQ5-2]|nr:hypothetical protein [Enterococcus sp. MMGLQ5-2]MBS7583706.1 hypothetical protein [Enterococcus sp. MMGLQ5-1]NPD11567.1 hypothetical protein [Enterococcus sp. MMGLQ5-1]NPD36311.1 hypothetical protein [Enterococcus sp. MMGLQ5-2]
MDAGKIFEEIKEVVAKGDFDQAKALLESHKDDLGPLFDQGKALLSNQADNAEGLLNKVKGFFDKK